MRTSFLKDKNILNALQDLNSLLNIMDGSNSLKFSRNMFIDLEQVFEIL